LGNEKPLSNLPGLVTTLHVNLNPSKVTQAQQKEHPLPLRQIFMTTQRSSLIDSAVALAVITAFFYAISTAYYDGYFQPLQLDPNVLDRNVQQSLYRGFVISLEPASKVLFIYTIGCILYSHFLLPRFNGWLRHSRWSKRQFLKLKHFYLGKRKDPKIEIFQKKHTLIACLYFGVFLTLIFSLMYFENKGKEVAFTDLKKIENDAIQPSDLITVKIDDKPKQLLSLMCGARNCAGIDPNTKIIYYFPQNGHSYQFIETYTKQIAPPEDKTP
jgi:hypothetical protein